MKKRQLIDVNELAEYLKITVETLYNWISQKKIPYVKVGSRLVRFDLEKIDEWLEQGSVSVYSWKGRQGKDMS